MFSKLLAEIYSVAGFEECKGMKCENCPMYTSKDEKMCDEFFKMAIILRRRIKEKKANE